MATEIGTLQEGMDSLTATKRSKTTEFDRVFKKEITTKDFAALPKFENVEVKIKEVQATIKTTNNQEKIVGIFEAIEGIINNVLAQNTKSILSDSIQVNVELVTEHILKTWKNPAHSKDFLQTGLALTKDEQKDCVFCGQELNITSKELLEAYSELFSQEYRTLQLNILQAVSKFEKWNSSTTVDAIQDKLASINIVLDLQEAKDYLKKLKDSATSEFNTKTKDNTYVVNFESYDAIIEELKRIQERILKIKEGNVLPKSAEINITALNKKIKEFEFSKTRHSPEWDDFIREYDDIDIAQESIKKKREKAREKLHLYSQKVFGIHLKSINKILEELKADFTICDFQPIKKIVGQDERIFSIEFFKCHKVSLIENAADKPNFKNTLSDSDKRVLAFAFFYSLMLHDEKLSDKIIVFDDPFSSFDSDRRLRTVQLLANPHLITAAGAKIEKVINQLIILTHESEFFKWIFQKLDKPKPLRIVTDGVENGVKKSTIIECDVYSEFIENANKKDLREIQAIYSSKKLIDNYLELCVKCRKVLESIFTRKYFFELKDEINSRGSIRSFVEKLKLLKLNEYDDVPKNKSFIFLCDNLNIEMHDNPLKNEGENAHDVLGDFLRILKDI